MAGKVQDSYSLKKIQEGNPRAIRGTLESYLKGLLRLMLKSGAEIRLFFYYPLAWEENQSEFWCQICSCEEGMRSGSQSSLNAPSASQWPCSKSTREIHLLSSRICHVEASVGRFVKHIVGSLGSQPPPPFPVVRDQTTWTTTETVLITPTTISQLMRLLPLSLPSPTSPKLPQKQREISV